MTNSVILKEAFQKRL